MERQNPVAEEFLRYNRWANLALFDLCCQLSPEVLASTQPGCYGTVYETLRHIVRGEVRYYWLLTGQRLQPPFSWDSQPSVAEMRAFAEQVSSALIQVAGEYADPERMISEVEENGEVVTYNALTLLIQIVNHGVEHRTNITSVLAAQGLQAPGIDGWAYLFARPERLKLTIEPKG